MQRRTTISLAMISVLLYGGAVGGPPASADELAPALEDGYVIVDPAEAVVRGEATFYPTGTIDDDTVVIVPDADGKLPGGLSQDDLRGLHRLGAKNDAAGRAAAKAAGLEVAGGTPTQAPKEASPFANHPYYSTGSKDWSGVFRGANNIGFNSAATVLYTFSVSAAGQQNAGQGLGYYRGYNGSQFGVWSQFYGLGFATSLGGGAKVPWGNVAATTQFRAKCGTSSVCTGSFAP